MLHILATVFFSGLLIVVVTGMALTLAGDWPAIRRVLRGDRAKISAAPVSYRIAAPRRQPMRRSAELRAAA